MKGDFSRLRFRPTAHYTSVLEQQGRVALDSDANEQCAINEYIRDTEATDIIGPFGGPIGDLGFGISIAGKSIAIGTGRYYVEGILCESETSLSYLQQPHLIDPPATDTQLLAGLQSGQYSAVQLFLEVWRRLVTALDDPCLLEPALGGADTTARLQTVWRVVAEGVLAPSRPVNLPGTGLRLPTGIDLGTLAGVVSSPVDGSKTSLSTAQPVLSCCDSMYQPVVNLASGTMSAQTTGASSECSCEPTPAAGYRGIENQLYRVEIQHAGDLSTATFKWSRENGSVVVGIQSISGNQIAVNSLGRDANLGFAPGQWVEIVDDSYQFGVPANRPGQLYQIQSVTPSQLSVTVTPPVSGIDATLNPRMRRWDQSGVTAGAGGIPVSSSWLDLENGIQVQFAAGAFRTGDYWLIPARTANGAIDWPPCGTGGGTFQQPHEIEVFRAPLACIHWANNQQFVIDDCRRKFPPLTSVTPGANAALHVTKINWNNDDILTFDQMLATGLTVSLDQAAASRIDGSIYTLTLEVPVVSQIETSAVATGLAPIVLRVSNPLDGQITINGADINWNLPFRDSTGAISQIQFVALEALDLMLLQGISYSALARARVRLAGRDVSAGSGTSLLFLDGQAFGAAGFRADKVTPCTTLTFPSGAGAKASDFESWFFLAPTLTVATLTVQPTSVNFSPTVPAPGSPVATLAMNYPPLVDTAVSLSVITPPGIQSAVGVPSSVTVPRGKISVTFPVSVRNTGVATAQVFQIVASLKNALGFTSSATATLTVTGAVIIQ